MKHINTYIIFMIISLNIYTGEILKIGYPIEISENKSVDIFWNWYEGCSNQFKFSNKIILEQVSRLCSNCDNTSFFLDELEKKIDTEINKSKSLNYKFKCYTKAIFISALLIAPIILLFAYNKKKKTEHSYILEELNNNRIMLTTKTHYESNGSGFIKVTTRTYSRALNAGIYDKIYCNNLIDVSEAALKSIVPFEVLFPLTAISFTLTFTTIINLLDNLNKETRLNFLKEVVVKFRTEFENQRS